MYKHIVISALLVLITMPLTAQDSTATIIFFRRDKLVGSAISYRLYNDTTFVGQVVPSTVLTYRCREGVQKFWAQTESKNFIFVDVKAGENYYVECSLAMGALVGTPSFRQIPSVKALPIIRELTHEDDFASNKHASLLTASNARDTVKALSNMFNRKRKAGKVRGVIFGIMSLSSLVSVAADSDGAGPETIAVLAALFGVTGTGIIQVNKYNEHKLELIISNFRQSKELPEWVRKKIKKKDFR